VADHNAVRERGLDQLYKDYIRLTVGATDDYDVECPTGIGPWSGDASESEIRAWQASMNEAGGTPPVEARLTQHLTGLAKWVAATEELNHYTDQGEEVPKKVQSAAERAWKADFKEPKKKERKWNLQLFMACPPGKIDKYSISAAGIFWRTLENPLTVQDLGAQLLAHASEHDIKTVYGENIEGRMRTDITKFNGGIFPCQEGQKPPTPYPILGIEKKGKKVEAVDESASPAGMQAVE